MVRFIEEAADDPNVLAIKQTLYRTSGDSPIVRALVRAARERQAGGGAGRAARPASTRPTTSPGRAAWKRTACTWSTGSSGLKTHCKVALVVRREGNGIRRYVHLGTGNYNPHDRAPVHRPLAVHRARRRSPTTSTALFNMLTGYSDAAATGSAWRWRRMTLQRTVLELIEREAQRAKKGEPARIVAKMNSLVDPTVIRALYAREPGGRGDRPARPRHLLPAARGARACPSASACISVVDRFLEHSRVFAFGAGAQRRGLPLVAPTGCRATSTAASR